MLFQYPSRLCYRSLALLLCTAAIAQGAHAAEPESEHEAMDAVLHDAVQLAAPGVAIAQESQIVQSLYTARGETFLWSRNGALSRQAHELADILHDAERFGLAPADYAAGAIATTVNRLSSAPDAKVIDFARLDLLLSRNLLRFISHLHFGRIDPRAAGFELKEPRTDLDVGVAVTGLSTAENVEAAINAAEPAFYHYRLLKQALLHYRELAASPLLTMLPALPNHSLRLGDSYAGAPALRTLLTALGDMSSVDPMATPADTILDRHLIDAVEHFQTRHGLVADGILNRRVYASLTTPMMQRVRQIELTLERWRWLPPFDTPPIIVNIPEFRLFAFQTVEDRVATISQMDVIVGETYPRTQTPIFLGDMQYVVFRPYWDIPRTITMREMLPKIQVHADYLASHHLEIVRGQSDDATIMEPTPATIAALAAGSLRLRQQPGNGNALGLIKFIFPNVHNVYLHSTPENQLFLRAQRAFSHGCIRVSDPGGLAVFVLHNAIGNWDREHIDAAMQGTNSLHVELRTPIRVMILYATAQATEAGPIQFFDDIYGHDRKLESLLLLAGSNLTLDGTSIARAASRQ